MSGHDEVRFRTWRDLEELALKSPLAHACLHMVRTGISREQALLETTIAVIRELEDNMRWAEQLAANSVPSPQVFLGAGKKFGIRKIREGEPPMELVEYQVMLAAAKSGRLIAVEDIDSDTPVRLVMKEAAQPTNPPPTPDPSEGESSEKAPAP